MVSLLSKCEEQYNIKITFSVETEPLGTGQSISSFTELLALLADEPPHPRRLVQLARSLSPLLFSARTTLLSLFSTLT